MSKGTEKAVDKDLHPFMVRASKNLEIEKLQYNKAHIKQTCRQYYTKLGKTQNISSKIKIGHVCPLPSFLFNTALDQLTKSVRERGKMKTKKSSYFHPFVDNMFLYMEDTEDHRKLLGLINTFSKVPWSKNQHKQLFIQWQICEEAIRKTTASKKKYLRINKIKEVKLPL